MDVPIIVEGQGGHCPLEGSLLGYGQRLDIERERKFGQGMCADVPKGGVTRTESSGGKI